MLSEPCILIRADNYHLLLNQLNYTHIQNIEKLRSKDKGSGHTAYTSNSKHANFWSKKLKTLSV